MDTTVDISIDRIRVIGYTPRSVFTPGETLTHIISLGLNTVDTRSVKVKVQQHDAFSDRCVAFTNDVEALSRQRNLWIAPQQSGSPNTWPVIGEAFDEEAGYRAAMIDGIVTMDRMLHSQTWRGPSHLSWEIEQFLAELANLSRQKRLWVRAVVPAAWPRIVRLDVNERGTATYVLRNTDLTTDLVTTLR